jgi:hypothetical protein
MWDEQVGKKGRENATEADEREMSPHLNNVALEID